MPVTSRVALTGLGSSGWAREGEQTVREGRGAVGGGHGGAGVAFDVAGPALADAALQHIEGADDAGEQVVEVVGDAARELAHRLHLLRLAQLLLGALALLHLGVQALVGGLKLGRALGDPPLEQPLGLDVLADIDVGAEPADDPPCSSRIGTICVRKGRNTPSAPLSGNVISNGS